MTRLLAMPAALVGLLAMPAMGPAASATPTDERPRASRVLVLSLPALSWADLRAHPMPNLERLLASSAVGDLTTRAVSRHSTLGDGYATIGAGARAAGVSGIDGLAFDVDEPFVLQRAGTASRVRTGRDAPSGLVNLSTAPVVDRNNHLLYDARPGALGDVLARFGYERAVIANADGDAPVTSATSYRRQAVMALMDGDGRVPSGRVDAGLLQPDPAAAFGVRLDERAVVEAFDLVWRPRSVVLVEGSDLVRYDVSRMVLSRQRREALQHGAMDRTDRLVGVLMARVDATRDVVMVVGPAASSARAGLTVAALRAPGVGAGLLRSGTTRRTRFVQLVDVAPTILDQLGIERPEVMEGRRFEAVRSHASLRSRAASLAGADHAAAFRDRQTTLAATVYTWAAGALVLAAVAVLTLGRHRRRSRGLAAAALGLVVFLPLTYLAGLVPFDDLGSGPYWLFLGAGSIAGGMVLSSWRRHALTPLIAALGIVFALLTVDIVTGGRLQLNTVFGYSPIVAGRFQGMGNLAYSMYTVSAIVLAGLLAHRVRPPWGTPLALGVVAAALLVDGLPFFGSDVGGVLSLVPAAGVFTMVLLGRRVRARVLLAWMATAAGALAGVGLLDLSRPPHHRTHLGRLFEKVGAGDLDGIVTVIQRKLHANLSVLTSVWIVSVLVSLAFVAWLAFAAPRRMAAVRSTVPELHAALSALPVLLVLGFALNDSGIAVPGMMFGVIDSVLVYLAVWVHPGPGVGPGSDADRAHGTGVSP